MRKTADALIASATARYAIGLLLICIFAVGSYVVLDLSMKRAQAVDRVLTEAADLRSEIHQTKIAAQQTADAARSRIAAARDLALALQGQADALETQHRALRSAMRNSPLTGEAWDFLVATPHRLDDGIAQMAREARHLAQQVLGGAQDPSVDRLLKPHGRFEMQAEKTQHAAAVPPPSGMRMEGGGGLDPLEDPHMTITEFIGFLRQQVEVDRAQVADIHTTLLVATLLVLLVEIFVVFRPLTSTARAEAKLHAQAEEELHWLATHDPLTGLYNRHAFECRLEELIVDGKPFALVLADLDRFKAVNDEFGHQAGDQVLKEVAARLAPVLRKGDFAARLGGDEFVIILRGCETAEDCLHVASRIKSETERPILLGASPAAIGFSAGCALWPVHGEASRDLVAAADLAMYHAKKSAMTACLIFDPLLTIDQTRSIRRREELKQAISEGAITPFYQDVVRIESGEPVRLEALARWMREGRLQSPESFISDMKKAGLMVELTLAMTRSVASDIAQWRKDGVTVPPVSVNLPPEALNCGDFAEQLLAIITPLGLAPSDLMLEISESVHFADRNDETWQAVEKLKASGFAISCDDFGTAQTTLNQLLHPDVSEIKLDRRFVKELGTSGMAATLIVCIQQMVRLMGKDLVVEGVETAEEADLLKRCGCTLVQGYLYGRPRGNSDTEADLKRGAALGGQAQRALPVAQGAA